MPLGRPRRALALAAVASAAAFAPVEGVRAETARADISYSASLGGFSVGSGTLTFAYDGGAYRADIGARVAGLARIFTSRVASAVGTGRIDRGRLGARSYALDIHGGAVPNVVRLQMASGTVTGLEASDLRPGMPDDRIPVTAAHKRGIIDPLAAFMITLPAGADPLDKRNCQRVQRVFDGRVRYDLRMVYGATTEVNGAPGSYSGPALICAVAYRPIAGFRPLTPEQRKFEESIEFNIWFVPVASTGVMLPHRVNIGTPYGLLTVDATRFEVTGASATAQTEVTSSIRRKTP